MDRKYQIFISSTYEDLKEERDEVVKAILEMGHIPVGMEMFSAADEEQWEIIKSHINESDYYVVIVANRYGKQTAEGISYTEKEYDYAVSSKLPILGFVLGEAASRNWPSCKTETTASEKLDAFKNKVKSKLVSFWQDGTQLAGQVVIALGKTFTTRPRPGWIRGTQGATPEILEEIARLSRENSQLRAQIVEEKEPSIVFHIMMARVYAPPSKNAARLEVLIIPKTGQPIVFPAHLVNAYVAGNGIEKHLGPISFSSDDEDLDASGYRLVVKGPGEVNIYPGYVDLHELSGCTSIEIILRLVLGGFSTVHELKAPLELTTIGGSPCWQFKQSNLH